MTRDFEEQARTLEILDIFDLSKLWETEDIFDLSKLWDTIGSFGPSNSED